MKNACQKASLMPKIIIALSSLFFLVGFSFPVIGQEKERGLANRIPKNLPIKIEILNENSEDVLKNVKIKITNIGEKPIYFLKFFISTKKDYLASNGNQYGFPLRFGRSELVLIEELATDEDIPLKKGESYTLSIDAKRAEKFSASRERSFRALPILYLFEFQALSFGDGTGYLGSGATFVSTKKKTSQLYDDYATPQKLTGFFLTKR